MRSKTLARAIATGWAAWATGSVLLFPATLQAQAAASLTPPSQSARMVASVAGQGPLKLGQVLEMAEGVNPSFRAKQAQLAEAQGVQADADALLFNNPQLSTDLTRRSVPQVGQGDERRREWSAGLSQTLEIGGQRAHRRDAAAAAYAALQAEIVDARRTARAEAASRFYKVLALQQRVVLESEALRLFEGTAAAIQKRRAAGEDTRLDANIAAVEAKRAQNQLAIAQEQLLGARVDLASSLQLNPAELPEVAGELDMALAPYGLPDLLLSVDAQPRLLALAEREKSANARLKLEQASTYPDLTVGINVGREGPGSARERVTTIGISVPLPLFRRNASGIGQARSELSQTQIEREVAARDGRASVNGLWLRLRSLSARVQRLQEGMLPALADNQQLSAKSQQAGQIGLLELIVVNRQTLDARRDLNDALTEYHTTRIELELAAGWSQEATQP